MCSRNSQPAVEQLWCCVQGLVRTLCGQAAGGSSAQAAGALPALRRAAACALPAVQRRRPPQPRRVPQTQPRERLTGRRCAPPLSLRLLLLLLAPCLRPNFMRRSDAGPGRAGSKWTARRRTLGWRHFHVSQKRVQSNGEKVCLLVSTCDASTQLWVPLTTLKSREAWAAGWLQKCELEAFVGPPCPACGEAGSVPCNLCSRAGQEIEF